MKRVVKKRASSKTIIKVFLATLFIFVVALLRVHLYALIDNLKYEMGKKTDKEERLLKERENLEKELYFLKSPSRIEKEALRLGMNYPKNWQIKEIKVKKNDS
jgi:cell division protein FtsL